MIEQTYFLDMIPGESTPPVVHVSQFDVNSRTLTFNLMKGGVAFVPDADMSVTLDGMKPDNHVFSYPMTVNGSSVSIDVLTQMTVVSGHVRCEVSVSNQIGKIGSANFILAVEESPIDSGSISESDIPIFEDLKNQAQQAAASAEQSASDAEGFAADAETAASSVSAILPASAGTTGQVLTKTATGADWETIDATDIETSSGVAIKSVNGNPVTITDALQGKALGVIATLEPIQSGSGDPSPTNIRPITGRTQVNVSRTERNLLPLVDNTLTRNGVTITVSSEGILLNGTSTNSVDVTLMTFSGKGNFISNDLNKATNADLYIPNPSGSGNVAGFVRNDTAFSNDGTELSVHLYFSYNKTFDNVLLKPMIRLATDSDSSFEPYQGQSVTVQLGQTVYGGTLNVTTGELTVTQGISNFEDLSWGYNGSNQRFFASAPLRKTGWVSVISSVFEIINGSIGVSDMPDHTMKCDGNQTTKNIFVHESAYSNATDFVNALTGQKICYELETPIELTLSPAQINLLTGTNIISTNADDLSVRYYATGQTGNVEGNIAFLLDKTASNETAVNTLAGSLAVIETSPATANHAVGDLIVYNNQLYEVTAAISVGETLTVGTNIQADSVANELVPQLVTKTATSSINDDQTVIYKVGKILIISLDFRTTATIPGYGKLYDMTVTPAGIASGVVISGTTTYPVFVYTDGSIQTRVALPSGGAFRGFIVCVTK